LLFAKQFTGFDSEDAYGDASAIALAMDGEDIGIAKVSLQQLV
jgi:hypothetical protein